MEATSAIGYVRVAPREASRSRPGLDVPARGDRSGVRTSRLAPPPRRGGRSFRPHAAPARALGGARGVPVRRGGGDRRRATRPADLLARASRRARRRGARAWLQPRRAGPRRRPRDRRGPAPRPGAVRRVVVAPARDHCAGLSGRAAEGKGRGRGRPVSTPPALADRIRTLRAGGSTLQAICDALNAEGQPTPRGGSHWRPARCGRFSSTRRRRHTSIVSPSAWKRSSAS